MGTPSYYQAGKLSSLCVPLWDGPAPFAAGATEQDIPRLYVYLPPVTERTTRAMIVLPGGGYEYLAAEHEGTNVAEWFQQRGIAAFILFYRLPIHGYRHPVPLLDAQRAVRLMRSRAAEWNINPEQIAIMGFSAGGHLASTLVTHFDAGDASAADPVERQSCRPDFAALIYPVITFRDGLTHKESKLNLLGPDPDPALVDNLCNETQVTPQTPPTVLVHAADDVPVLIENSRVMLAALQKAGVPCALQEYAQGAHGFGYAPPYTRAQGWLSRALEWLESQGFTA